MAEQPAIYALRDPRDGSMFYVGESTAPLRRQWGGYGTEVRNRLEIVRKAVGQVDVVVLESMPGSTRPERVAREKAWIARLRAEGAPLLNRNGGGNGHIPSLAERAQQSARLKGRKKPPRTDQHRANLAAAVRASTSTPEWRRRRQSTQRRVWQDPAYRAHMSEAHRGQSRPRIHGSLAWQKVSSVRWTARQGSVEWEVRRNAKTTECALRKDGRVVGAFPSRQAAATWIETQAGSPG